MRLTLTFLLIFGLLAVFNCEDVAEDMEGNEEEEESEEGADGEEGADDGEGDEGSGANNLQHYEDDGSHEQLTEQHMRDLHKKLDADNNGKVSVHEAMTFAKGARKAVALKEIEGVFDEIESTKDGHLSFDEHMADLEETHDGMDEADKKLAKEAEIKKFKAADVNGDNKLDKHELVSLMHPDTHPEVFVHHAEEEFRKRDDNKDGKLSSEEFGEDAGHDHETGGFEGVDANKDGFIDMEEFKHYESGNHQTEYAMNKLLELADKDGDKHFSQKELERIADELEGHTAHSHILDWVFHDEM